MDAHARASRVNPSGTRKEMHGPALFAAFNGYYRIVLCPHLGADGNDGDFVFTFDPTDDINDVPLFLPIWSTVFPEKVGVTSTANPGKLKVLLRRADGSVKTAALSTVLTGIRDMKRRQARHLVVGLGDTYGRKKGEWTRQSAPHALESVVQIKTSNVADDDEGLIQALSVDGIFKMADASEAEKDAMNSTFNHVECFKIYNEQHQQTLAVRVDLAKAHLCEGKKVGPGNFTRWGKQGVGYTKQKQKKPVSDASPVSDSDQFDDSDPESGDDHGGGDNELVQDLRNTSLGETNLHSHGVNQSPAPENQTEAKRLNFLAQIAAAAQSPDKAERKVYVQEEDGGGLSRQPSPSPYATPTTAATKAAVVAYNAVQHATDLLRIATREQKQKSLQEQEATRAKMRKLAEIKRDKEAINQQMEIALQQMDQLRHQAASILASMDDADDHNTDNCHCNEQQRNRDGSGAGPSRAQ